MAGVGPRHGRKASTPGAEKIATAKKRARDGDLDGAAAAAREAAALDPRLEEAYWLLGSLCSLRADAAGARAAYADGLGQLPASSALHHAVGMLELEGGALPMAVAALERAHELTGGKSAEIGSDLAYAYVFVERLDDAERLAGGARKADPKSFAAAYTHGEVLLRKRKAALAVAAFEAALQITPNEPSARRRLAAAHAANGDAAAALTIYDALRAGPSASDPRIHAAAAGVLLELGRASEAVSAMQAAIRLAPDNPRLLELLLHTQEQAGETKAAKRTRKQLDELRGRTDR